MIKDYEVTKEKLSSVRYVGTYTFRFKEDAVRTYFAGSDISYSDVKSDPVLILPFYQTQKGLTLWAYNNSWKSAWNRLDDDDAIVPIAVPIGDIQDVADIKDNEAVTYNPHRLELMLARYGATEAVIAIASPDAIFIQSANNEQDTVEGAVNISLYRTDRSGPELVRDLTVSAKAGQTRASFFDDAVQQVQSILGKEWKEQTRIDPSELQTIMARVPVYSLTQWVQIQRALDRISMVDDVVVDSMTPQEIIIKLTYHGPESLLNKTLRKENMNLQKLYDDIRAGITAQTPEKNGQVGYILRYVPDRSSSDSAPVSEEDARVQALQ
jgi:hypothetical protein